MFRLYLVDANKRLSPSPVISFPVVVGRNSDCFSTSLASVIDRGPVDKTGEVKQSFLEPCDFTRARPSTRECVHVSIYLSIYLYIIPYLYLCVIGNVLCMYVCMYICLCVSMYVYVSLRDEYVFSVSMEVYHIRGMYMCVYSIFPFWSCAAVPLDERVHADRAKRHKLFIFVTVMTGCLDRRYFIYSDRENREWDGLGQLAASSNGELSLNV